MRTPSELRSFLVRLGWIEKVFAALVALNFLLLTVAPLSGWRSFVRFAAVIFGLIVFFKLIRVASKRVIWRLRYRLLVTYLFIAVVPVTLILLLAGLGAYALASQFAVYLVSSELDRRIEALHWSAVNIVRLPPEARSAAMERIGSSMLDGLFPAVDIMSRNGRETPLHYPANSSFSLPPQGWNAKSGMMLRDGRFFVFGYAKNGSDEVLAAAPVTRRFLSNLVPKLGLVSLYRRAPTGVERGRGGMQLNVGGDDVNFVPDTEPPDPEVVMPPAAWRGDVEVRWFSMLPVIPWDNPSKDSQMLLQVRARPSTAFGSLFTRQSDLLQGAFPIALVVVSSAFLIVELISLVVGISMTRTITRAVHHLYEATQRIREGDFSHRIEVKGRDQLAELGYSFNTMTERLQELLVVAKEKERLQSEIEIAREVQNQLYPKKVPDSPTLRLTAVCNPARMVSGDYFDYECLHNTRVAIAVGDVAGKGISAALLMATLQSSLRTELRASIELAASAVGDGARLANLSTSQLVSHLNKQLYAYTSPEKYATFYLAIYDENSSILTYTNAGHLPPVLIRDGEASRLNVDGTVVGAFPFAQYDESQVALQSGDLLVIFTDGVSEPENVYGEMFGEDRLSDLVVRNAHRPDHEIVEIVTEAVHQWTGSPELQDDMTLLLARRL